MQSIKLRAILLTIGLSLTSFASLGQSAERADASTFSAKAPKNPGAKARALSKIIPCTDQLEYRDFNSDSNNYDYQCFTSYDSYSIDITIFNKSKKQGNKMRKQIVNEYCFSADPEPWVTFTDFKNYSWDGSYRPDKETKALLQKFKRLYKHSEAYSLSSNGMCKHFK